ncbi:MAG: HAD family hydrolase [Acidimicrobiales bacterium]
MAKAGSGVRAVLLDAGGVLVMPDPRAFRGLLSPYGIEISDEGCHRAHFEIMREMDRLGHDDFDEADRFAARYLGLPESDVAAFASALADLYLNHPLVPAPGAQRQLHRLRTAGFLLGIVSNATGTMQQMLAEHRICSTEGGEAVEVGVVIDSAVVGVAKPDPAIFTLALDALGVTCAEAVFIGDTVVFDMAGASKAAIRGFHLDPYDLCPETDHDHVRSLQGFVDEIIRGLD